MNVNLLEIAIQGLFALIFLQALRDLLRHRDLLRLEIAALFATLAITLTLQPVLDVFNVEFEQAGLIAGLTLVAHPYLFLRLVGHFRRVPRYQHALAMAMLVFSWGIVLSSGSSLSANAAILAIALFLYVEIYAIYLLVRAARSTLGVTRIRAGAIICGSGCLALVLLFLGLSEAAPRIEDAVSDLAVMLLFASAIAYYLGFMSPRWFRSFIQRAEVWRYLDRTAERTAESRLTAALDHVAPVASRALGGKAAIVAVGQPGADVLHIHLDPESRVYGGLVDMPTISIGGTDDPLTRAWRYARPTHFTSTEMQIQPMSRLAHAVGGAESALVAPLVGQDGPLGILVVLFDQRSIFLQDDLDILVMLADHAAADVEKHRLYETSQRAVTNNETLLELSRVLADEVDATGVARQLALHVSRLIPSTAWGVLLPTPDGGLEIVATGGENADERGNRRFEPGSGISGRAFQAGHVIVVDDVSGDERYVGLPSDVRSELAVPLQHRGESVGLLNFERREVAAFSDADVALAEIVAAIAAQAITRARLLEQLHHQNLALDAASRHKSEFLATMSHELRTPLNAIIGFSELMIDASPGDFDDATEAQFLETIHSSGRHLLSLINDILDLSKVEAGHMELMLSECVIADVVTQILSTLQPLATRSAVTLRMDVDTMAPVVADSGKLKQILYNLLSNAIKFTPEGGVVTVQARNREDGLQLSVEDTGIGIDTEDQERIFQEFQQIDMGPDRHFEGTGLGLTLTRRFVELHGGRIWVESTPGEGSQFHVFLPETGLPPTAPEPEFELELDEFAPSFNGDEAPLVLVVEDDPRAASLLSLYLERGGYRARVAVDGGKAIDEARELQPAIITLDVLLPTLDGWEVLRALKRDAATRDIPVIISSVVDDKELGFALGATDYFVKPLERETLLARLERFAFSPQRGEHGFRALAIDDDPASLDLMAAMLEPAGYELLKAGGGAEGIARAEESQPDLILLDLMMEEVDGFAVVDAVRGNPLTKDVPILIVTAKELTGDDKQRLNGRVTMLLQKGTFAAVDLVAWVDHTLSQIGDRSKNASALE